MRSLFSRLEALAREHGASRVVCAVLEVGEISNVVPELLKQAFVAFREVEPLLAEARLEIREIPLAATCTRCQVDFQPRAAGFRCPSCGAVTGLEVRGEDLVLRDVELEVPDSPRPPESAAGVETGGIAETERNHA